MEIMGEQNTVPMPSDMAAKIAVPTILPTGTDDVDDDDVFGCFYQ